MICLGLKRGLFFLSILAVLIVPSAWNYAGAENTFKVAASWTSATSDAVDTFDYDPETGKLYQVTEVDQKMGLREIRSFGAIPGLKRSELEVLAADFVRNAESGKTAVVVIRHGHWVSVLDVTGDKVLASNIGPFRPSGKGEHFNKILHRTDGSVVVTFSARITSARIKASTPREAVVVVDTRDNTVGWFTVRTDKKPQLMNATLVEDRKIEFAGVYLDPIKKGKNLPVPEDAKIRINLKSGEITQYPGAGILRQGKIKNVDNAMPLLGMYYAEAVHEKVEAYGATPQELMATGNPDDAKAREAAKALAKDQINFSRGIGTHIRQGMSHIYGQAEAIETLAKFAQQQVEAEMFTVIALGGPSGVGKTSGFEAFMSAFLKANNIQSEEPVFIIRMTENKDPRMIETNLFGSKPPYIGSDSPSDFVQWLLKHPEGGGILLDEVEKAPVEALETLMGFLEKGEVRLTPALTSRLVAHYEDTPKDQWPPALFEATKGGVDTNAAIVIKLTPRHVIGLGTNAGGENFGMNGAGKEVSAEQDIILANKRFTGEVLKKDMHGRGYKVETLNRIRAWIAFKMLTPTDHARVVSDRMDEVEERFKTKLIDFKFTDSARRFFETETFDPRSGARNVKNQVDQWVEQNLRDAVVEKAVVDPGDTIIVDVEKGNGSTIASVMRLSRNGGAGEVLAEYTVGRPLPPSPKELLAKAKANLIPTLEKRIIGHRKEIRLLSRAIIAELAKAVRDPARQGKPVVIYFDGTPGIGKTEIAKAVAEALFEDSGRLTRVDFNDIVNMETFYRFGVDKMKDAVKTSPESMVMLWDELPRAGDGTGYKQMIENALLSVLDEAKLPNPEAKGEKIDLPPATIVIATGNLAAKALRPGAHSMSNRELLAEFRLMARHPERFLAVFGQSFGEAFRSRLGKPLLFSPLSDEAVETLRDRLFESNTKILTELNIKPVLTESAKEFFMKEYVPMEGGRWIANTMKLYVESALITIVTGEEEKFRGTEFRVVWDEAKRELVAEIYKGEKRIQTETLAEVPRTKADFHSDSRERAAWKTSVHEIGHALVEAYFHGPRAIAEINTFGGGEGGWMEPATDAAKRDMYPTTYGFLKRIAVMLGGHIAEKRYIKDLATGQSSTATGASSDFERAREMAVHGINDGAIPELRPLGHAGTNDKGVPIHSEKRKQEIERMADYIIEWAWALSERALEANEKLHLEMADKLHKNQDMNMTGEEFTRAVEGRLVEFAPEIFEETRLLADQAMQRRDSVKCEALLLPSQASAVAKPSIWRRIMNFFTGRK